MRAVVYSRFSSALQRCASIEDQNRNCRHRAEAEGWKLVGHFADEAISGAIADRPGYKRMLRAAAAGEFEILLVDDLSRLARDQVESERCIRRLEFAGIRIVATSDGYDTASKAATRKITRGIKSMMNELRLDELREQVHRGQTGQALARFWCGGRPYGYKLIQVTDPARLDPYGKPAVIGTRLEIDREKAPVVCEIFERFANEWSMPAIANELNRRGVPSPGAAWRNSKVPRHKWVATGVASILENSLYAGVYAWNKTSKSRDPETGSRRVRRRPGSEQIRNEMPELRIVPPESWARVQARRTGRARAGAAISAAIKRGGRGPKFLFSSLLRCGECGSSMVVVGGAANWYGCGGRKLGGEHACRNDLKVKRAIVEARLLAPIKSDLLSDELIEEVERRYRKAMQAKPARPDEARLATLRAEVENLTDAIASGELRSSQALGARLAKAEAELAALTVARSSRGSMRVLPMRVADRYRGMVAQLEAALGTDVARARSIIRELVGGAIKVAPDERRAFLIAQVPTGAESLILQAVNASHIMMMPGRGLEPPTRALRMRCSTS